jgi:hypothetical protein
MLSERETSCKPLGLFPLDNAVYQATGVWSGVRILKASMVGYPPWMANAPEAGAVRHGTAAQAETRRGAAMTESTPLVTILCAQCSQHAQVRRGEPLPEGWAGHVGLLSCSETCREILQSMGLIPEE